jgi:UDP-2,3-diacylglucosamine hydrolase
MHVFVSDVHLNEPQSKRYGAFLRLLDKVLENREITDFYLVGDIFDLWYGDRKIFKEMHKSSLEKIEKIATQKNVHYFEGNHDFQLGAFWKKMGVKTYPRDAEFKINKQSFLISHGDLLDKENKEYLRLRWFFRTWLSRLLIKILPQSLLFWIGSSITTTEQKGEPSLEEQKKFLKNWSKWTQDLYKTHPFDVFICGHYHFRTDFIFNEGKARALNLGTWLDGKNQVLVYKPKEKSLKFLEL